jgi:hypothetical protein
MSGPDSAGNDGRAVICILGMHRSGTSLIAQMINLLGVDLGPSEQMLPPQPDNPMGFWEYRPFVFLNERILTRFWGTWDAPPTFPPGWWRRPTALDLRLRVRALVHRDFRHSALWGWKDPRTCLTLPFWRSLFPELIAIICVRDPVDVARSLAKREDIPVAQGMRLWELYLRSAIEHTEGRPRLVVAYEDAVRDPVAAALRMNSMIAGERQGGLDEARVASMLEIVDPGLQHAQSADRNATMSPPVEELYAELREMAATATSGRPPG